MTATAIDPVQPLASALRATPLARSRSSSKEEELVFIGHGEWTSVRGPICEKPSYLRLCFACSFGVTRRDERIGYRRELPDRIVDETELGQVVSQHAAYGVKGGVQT